MIESIYSHWQRKEYTHSEASRLVFDFMQSLKSFNAVFYGQWFELASTLNDALRNEVSIDLTSIEKKITAVNEDIPDIKTYTCSFWNGKKQQEDQISLSFRLKTSIKKKIPNSIVLSIAQSEEQQKFFENKENLDNLIKIFVDISKPDYIKIDGNVVYKK